MAVPFPEAQLEPLIYMALGSLVTLVGVLSWQVRRLKARVKPTQKEPEKPRIDRIGLSKRAEDVLNLVLDEPMLQSDLPQELEVSKATVSNAVAELSERGLIKRKKKANTYLVEPKRDRIQDATGS